MTFGRRSNPIRAPCSRQKEYKQRRQHQETGNWTPKTGSGHRSPGAPFLNSNVFSLSFSNERSQLWKQDSIKCPLLPAEVFFCGHHQHLHMVLNIQTKAAKVARTLFSTATTANQLPMHLIPPAELVVGF